MSENLLLPLLVLIIGGILAIVSNHYYLVRYKSIADDWCFEILLHYFENVQKRIYPEYSRELSDLHEKYVDWINKHNMNYYKKRINKPENLAWFIIKDACNIEYDVYNYDPYKFNDRVKNIYKNNRFTPLFDWSI